MVIQFWFRLLLFLCVSCRVTYILGVKLFLPLPLTIVYNVQHKFIYQFLEVTTARITDFRNITIEYTEFYIHGSVHRDSTLIRSN